MEPDTGSRPTAEEATEALIDLEVAVADERRLDRRFELFEAIVMSIAAVMAAWAGFQASKWSGAQDEAYNQAAALRVESTENATLASERSLGDLDTFGEWLDALDREGAFDTDEVLDTDYEPDEEELSGFWYTRFRPEFRAAVDAWLATEPLVNPDAPRNPFVVPEYVSGAREEANRLAAEADEELAVARHANAVSDDYVLITILLATVLFFAGISSKMDTFKARALLSGVATVLLVVCGLILLSFPIEL